jgi:hypothetical protein
MKQNETKLSPKIAENLQCDLCHYFAYKNSDFKKHLQTIKHKNRESETFETEMKQNVAENLQCICGILCNSRTTLWRHKKKCNFQKNIDLEKKPSSMDKDDLIIALLKQNSELLEIVKNGTSNNSHNTNTNCMNNNKTFNLQFFLNETCKDAMNIMDFVDSIKLQLSDLEKVGEIGYVQGISNIITTNLKALDVSLRPVHCTDKKRETIYIKDQDKWSKDDENKSKLRKAIKRVANKNIKLLPQFREKYPDYKNSSSRISDKYDKIVVEAMGGSHENNTLDNEDKIIHNISKCSIIDKYIEN